jgi:hypothetical protein
MIACESPAQHGGLVHDVWIELVVTE